MSRAAKGSVGGASNEAGGEYRRALAALFAAYMLNGVEFPGLPISGKIESVRLEADAAVDDLVVELGAGRLSLQAKRSLTFGRPLNEVLEQWLRAVRDEAFDPEFDYLAGAAGRLSSSLSLANQALERRRGDARATWTQREADAVERLREALRALDASDDQVDTVLTRALFIDARVENEHESDAQNGQLLLDGHVVEKGHGRRAWRELIAIAGRAARQRQGYSLKGWLSQLRDAGVPLTADTERSRAAELERECQALQRYRTRIRESGETLDLTELGARVAPIPIAEADAELSVRGPDERGRERGRDPLWAFRRRGRVILTGLPGGGKSTVVRSVAARWAKRDDWALPIIVSLRRLGGRERFRSVPLRDSLLDLAVEKLPPRDRPLVRDALDRALDEGATALFLDGLDEAFDRSLDLASDIAGLLREIAPDTDVLLATRDAAYADARILGFPQLIVNSPQHAEKAVRGVLIAYAQDLGVGDAETWVDERVEWVKATLRTDRKLAETPLLPVLMAILAAERERHELPHTRANILVQVIRTAVERHELRRRSETGGLDRDEMAEALLDAYALIAAALLQNENTAPRAALSVVVQPYLRDHWGQPLGTAKTTSEAILRFWDESGIFVARGAEKQTSARLQLFLEIGAALDAAGRSNEAGAWVDAVADHPGRTETLTLAAGLSQEIAEALVAVAIKRRDESLARAAATSLRQGGRVSDPILRGLIRLLVDLVREGGTKGWDFFKLSTQLPVPEDLQAGVLSALQCFDEAHQIVGRAFAFLEWDRQDWARTQILEAGLRITELPNLDQQRIEEKPGVLVLATIDEALMRVKVSAAFELLPQRPDLASVVAEGLDHASMSAHFDLLRLLEECGHQELVKAAHDKMRISVGRNFNLPDIDADVQRTLDTICGLADPAELTKEQQRRLDELASFVETLDLNDLSSWPRNDDKAGDLRERWYQLVAALGGFDSGVLAAQARLVQAQLGLDEEQSALAPFFSLFDGAEAADLDGWDRVPDIAAGLRLAVHLLGGGHALAWVAARAIVEHPDCVAAADKVEQRLPTVPRRSKRAAVWARLCVSAEDDGTIERLANDDDPWIRAAIGSIVQLTKQGVPTPLASELLKDRERMVIVDALENLGRNTAALTCELREALEGVFNLPGRPYTCPHCGAANSAERESCASCNVVTWNPATKAREVLQSLAGEQGD